MSRDSRRRRLGLCGYRVPIVDWNPGWRRLTVVVAGSVAETMHAGRSTGECVDDILDWLPEWDDDEWQRNTLGDAWEACAILREESEPAEDLLREAVEMARSILTERWTALLGRSSAVFSSLEEQAGRDDDPID